MSSKRQLNELRSALESFGRCGKGLTAENLENFPGLLEALFEEDTPLDPKERLRLAERVRRTIVSVVSGCRDATDRHVGNVLFAIEDELHDMGVGERLKHFEDDDIYIRPQYYAHRDRLLPRIERELRKEFHSHGFAVPGGLLSAEAQRASRQLFRNAQRALIRIDAYHFCVGFSYWLRLALASGEAHPSHAWLRDYIRGPEGTRLVPLGRTEESDFALWFFAHFRKHLRVMLKEPTGRDYLLENLSAEIWEQVQTEAPFRPGEIEALLSILDQGQLDAPNQYVDDLCSDDQGRGIHDRYLAILTNNGYTTDLGLPLGRCRLLSNELLELCIALQRVFQEDAVSSPRDECEWVVGRLIGQAVDAIQVPVKLAPAKLMGRMDLVQDVLRRLPPRYRSEEADPSRRWNGDPPDQSLWSLPY